MHRSYLDSLDHLEGRPMDSVTAIVLALALGARATKDDAGQAVKGAYSDLKALIKNCYTNVDVDQLDRVPGSKNRQGVVEEELRAAQAHKDPELIARAQALLDLVRRERAEAAAVIGVDLKEVEAANLRLRNVVTSGIGVRVEQARFSGNIEASGVRASV